MSNTFGVLFIIFGLIIIVNEEMTVASGMGMHLHPPMNYVTAFPIILLGLYIFYLNHQQKKK